jgi:BirA family biotin operon repressor/biotin-[acetyl-CoA-carboxylase] ligase
MSEDITQLQIDILKQLREHPRSFFAPRELAERFSLPLQRVNRAIRELENWGYKLERDKNDGIRYLASPDVLFPHEIEYGLATKLFVGSIYSLDRVASTNVLAHKYAERGETEGTLIIAERQTAGKGRLGRSWHSPARRGLYLSIILRPPIAPARAPGISLIAALSVAEAIKARLRLPAMIKWPNDVLCHERKVCGVLTELAAELDRVRYIIVGIGINVNHDPRDFPDDLRMKATSLKIATGASVGRIELLRSVLERFERHYRRFLKDGLGGAIKSIRAISSVLDREVTFRLDGQVRRGRALDITQEGMLVIESGGRILTLGSGEITLEESY